MAAVVGWTRWREIDEQHVLGGLRAGLHRVAGAGRLPAAEIDLLAHMVLAAVNEAALLIAQSNDPKAALNLGQSTVETLLTRLLEAR